MTPFFTIHGVFRTKFTPYTLVYRSPKSMPGDRVGACAPRGTPKRLSGSLTRPLFLLPWHTAEIDSSPDINAWDMAVSLSLMSDSSERKQTMASGVFLRLLPQPKG